MHDFLSLFMALLLLLLLPCQYFIYFLLDFKIAEIVWDLSQLSVMKLLLSIHSLLLLYKLRSIPELTIVVTNIVLGTPPFFLRMFDSTLISRPAFLLMYIKWFTLTASNLADLSLNCISLHTSLLFLNVAEHLLLIEVVLLLSLLGCDRVAIVGIDLFACLFTSPWRLLLHMIWPVIKLGQIPHWLLLRSLCCFCKERSLSLRILSSTVCRSWPILFIEGPLEVRVRLFYSCQVEFPLRYHWALGLCHKPIVRWKRSPCGINTLILFTLLWCIYHHAIGVWLPLVIIYLRVAFLNEIIGCLQLCSHLQLLIIVLVVLPLIIHILKSTWRHDTLLLLLLLMRWHRPSLLFKVWFVF